MSEPQHPHEATPIDDPSLGLPRPLVRGLIAVGLTSLGAVWESSDADLLRIHGVGPKGLRMVRALHP